MPAVLRLRLLVVNPILKRFRKCNRFQWGEKSCYINKISATVAVNFLDWASSNDETGEGQQKCLSGQVRAQVLSVVL